MSATTYHTLDYYYYEWTGAGRPQKGEVYDAAIDALWRHADACVNRAEPEIYTIEDAMLDTIYHALVPAQGG